MSYILTSTRLGNNYKHKLEHAIITGSKEIGEEMKKIIPEFFKDKNVISEVTNYIDITDGIRDYDEYKKLNESNLNKDKSLTSIVTIFKK